MTPTTTQHGMAIYIHESMHPFSPRLFWIHGYTLNAATLMPIIAQLPTFTHVVVDLPGHGASEPFDKALTLPELTQQLSEIAIAHATTHLVALSFGGLLALQLAYQFPELFSSVTLAAPGRGDSPQDAEIGALYGQLYMLHSVFGVTDNLRQLWLTSKIFDGSRSQAGLHQQLHEAVQQHSWAELGSRVMQNLSCHPQTPEMLCQITARTRVMVGDQEMPAFRDIATSLADDIPNCEQIILDGGVHHLCMLQTPVRAAEIIREQVEATEAIAPVAVFAGVR